MARTFGDPGPSGDRRDPTLMRNQPALRTSSGRIWLVVGALMAAICVVSLLLQLRNNVPLTVLGVLVVALLYLAMLVLRFVTAQPPRLVLLACFFAAMPVWTIAWLFVIVANVE
jgi:hypothetical protein